MPHLEGSEATIAYEQSGQGPDLVWVAGGGSRGGDWRLFQTPFFDDRYRSTTFDGRGIGDTTCDVPQPWPIEAFARDTAELIEAVCEPPVAIVGSSLGSAIVQQVAIDRPDLLRCAVVMGTGALEHRLGLGLPGGGDRVPPRGRQPRRHDGRHPLRVDVLPGARARRPRAVAEAARAAAGVDGLRGERAVADPAVGGVAALRPACPAAVGAGAHARDRLHGGRAGAAAGRPGDGRDDPKRASSTCSRTWATPPGTATPTTPSTPTS